MKHFLYLLIGCILCSCGSSRHARGYKYKENWDPGGKHKIDLTDYELYIREVSRDSIAEKKEAISIINRPQNEVTQYSLAPHDIRDPSKKLIEVEYLLFSAKKKKVVYITTVPDVNQRYYAADRKKHQHRDSLNVYDFNTFHLGNVDDRGPTNFIKLKSLEKEKTYSWEYAIQNDTFSILRILEYYNNLYDDERSVVNSILGGARFCKVGNFSIFFRSNKLGPLELVKQEFYFFSRRNKFCVYFKLNPSANQGTRRGNQTITFSTLLFKKSKQVPVDPSIVWEPNP